MQLSGKITNSVLIDLQNRGCEFEALVQSSELTREFMRDPSGFLDAERVERFLEAAENFAADHLGLANYISGLGLRAYEVKAWGALDSVLRMIEKPQNIFLQPQRFLSYFVSPPPPIANIHHTDANVEFDLPIASDEYPFVVTYLCAAIEAVPTFMGGQPADAKWIGTHLSISWAERPTLLNEEDFSHRQMAPEVMQSLISALEKSEQKSIEQSRELERIKNENRLAAQAPVRSAAELTIAEGIMSQVHDHVLRLQDYFTRSQQLITLLVGQNRTSPQIREAMKRVNWDHVQKTYPEVTQDLLTLLRSENNSKHP